MQYNARDSVRLQFITSRILALLFSLSSSTEFPRNALDGTVFRAPIVIENIPRYVQGWTLPIIIGRHAHADQYRCQQMAVTEPGKFKIVFEPSSGAEATVLDAFDFTEAHEGGVAMGMYNTKASISGFARSCFEYALQEELPLYMSTKNTILKQ